MALRLLPRLLRRKLNAQRRVTRTLTTTAAKAVLPNKNFTLPTQITTLPSGLRVATEEGFGATATIGVWIDAGSAFEDNTNNGTAHFLEHMAFKGTKTRSKEQIESLVENLGANLNAYTSREQTVYVTQCFKNDIPEMVDLLADILQRSELRREHVEAERSTILKEKKVVEESEEELLFDHMHAVAYEGHPLSLTILGEARNIKHITRPQLIEYIKTHYTAPRMVIVGTGAVKHDDLVRLSSSAFDSLSVESSPPPSIDVPWHGSEIRVNDTTKPVTYLGIGFEAVGWSHPYYFAFLIINSVLGSWDRNLGAGNHITSPLANTLASRELAQSLLSFYTCYNHSGLVGVYMEVPPTMTAEAAQEVFKCYKTIAETMTEEELERAKTKVKASILMNLDGSMAVAEDIGRQVLSIGRRMSGAETFMRIDAVQLSDIRDCINVHFRDVCPAVVAIGPTDWMASYNEMRDMTVW